MTSHSPLAPDPQLRRTPQQERSRRRVEEVLAAADAVLAADGAEALSTTRVAADAGISIGSLYQWFPNKESILEALALRYVDDFTALARELADRATEKPFDDPVGEMLTAFAAAFRDRPGFRAMWFGGLRTESLRDATRPGLTAIGEQLFRILSASAPHASPETIGRVARLMVLSADALLRQAFRADPDGDPELLDDTADLLRTYLKARLG
jgi:AcrR family transcriptional regulator